MELSLFLRVNKTAKRAKGKQTLNKVRNASVIKNLIGAKQFNDNLWCIPKMRHISLHERDVRYKYTRVKEKELLCVRRSKGFFSYVIGFNYYRNSTYIVKLIFSYVNLARNHLN